MPVVRKQKNLKAFGATLVPLAVAALFFWLALGAGSQAHEPDEKAHGKRPFLGVVLEEETEHAEGGARVTGVVGESAAEEAGFEEGDIIVGFDGRAIRGPMGLTESIHDHEVGDRVEIVVIRDGAEQSLDVELGSRGNHFAFAMPHGLGERIRIELEDLKDLEGLEHRFDFNFGECEGDDCQNYAFSWSGRPKLGVQLTGTTPELRRHLGGEEDAGVLVTRVLPGTPAENADIRVGDLIVAVDGEAVEDASDIRRALRSKDGENVEVEVIRDGGSQRIDVSLPEVERDHSGPHSLHFAPGGEASAEISRAVRAAMSEARQAVREAGRVQREAHAEARAAFHEAMSLRRKAVAY